MPELTLKIADITANWDRVRAGLERALAHGDAATPEDVREEVEAGEAFLVLSEDFGAVWQVRVEAYSGEKTLWIWAAWSEHNDGGALAKYQEEFTRVARNAGLDRVAFASSRKGYSRALDHSWKATLVEYERRVK